MSLVWVNHPGPSDQDPTDYHFVASCGSDYVCFSEWINLQIGLFLPFALGMKEQVFHY